MNINKLKRFLQDNASLTYVALSCEWIDDNGVKLIGNWLGQNKTITELDLSSNREISEEGEKELVKALRLNNTLTNLRFEYNNIINEAESFILINQNKAFVKETAKFLINKFIKKKNISLEQEVKYLKYYQVADKKLLQQYLNKIYTGKQDIKAADSIISDKNIQQYISKNFMKLAVIAKNEVTIKVKNNKTSKIDKIKDFSTKSPFEVTELLESILGFLGKKSLWEIKFDSQNFYKLLRKVKKYTNKFKKDSTEYKKFIEACQNQNKSLLVLAKKLVAIKDNALTNEVFSFLDKNNIKILGIKNKQGILKAWKKFDYPKEEAIKHAIVNKNLKNLDYFLGSIKFDTLLDKSSTLALKIMKNLEKNSDCKLFLNEVFKSDQSLDITFYIAIKNSDFKSIDLLLEYDKLALQNFIKTTGVSIVQYAIASNSFKLLEYIDSKDSKCFEQEIKKYGNDLELTLIKKLIDQYNKHKLIKKVVTHIKFSDKQLYEILKYSNSKRDFKASGILLQEMSDVKKMFTKMMRDNHSKLALDLMAIRPDEISESFVSDVMKLLKDNDSKDSPLDPISRDTLSRYYNPVVDYEYQSNCSTNDSDIEEVDFNF